MVCPIKYLGCTKLMGRCFSHLLLLLCFSHFIYQVLVLCLNLHISHHFGPGGFPPSSTPWLPDTSLPGASSFFYSAPMLGRCLRKWSPQPPSLNPLYHGVYKTIWNCWDDWYSITLSITCNNCLVLSSLSIPTWLIGHVGFTPINSLAFIQLSLTSLWQASEQSWEALPQ